jgi:hypothetical protein
MLALSNTVSGYNAASHSYSSDIDSRQCISWFIFVVLSPGRYRDKDHFHLHLKTSVDVSKNLSASILRVKNLESARLSETSENIWDVTQYSLVKVYWHFGGPCCLQNRKGGHRIFLRNVGELLRCGIFLSTLDVYRKMRSHTWMGSCL